MLIIKRSDDCGLVVSSAQSLTDTRLGMIVDMGNEEMYIVHDCSISELQTWGGSMTGLVGTLYKNWRGWPITS